MAYVRINLDTAEREPYQPMLERMMSARPHPVVDRRVITSSGNRIVPVAR